MPPQQRGAMGSIIEWAVGDLDSSCSDSECDSACDSRCDSECDSSCETACSPCWESNRIELARPLDGSNYKRQRPPSVSSHDSDEAVYNETKLALERQSADLERARSEAVLLRMGVNVTLEKIHGSMSQNFAIWEENARRAIELKELRYSADKADKERNKKRQELEQALDKLKESVLQLQNTHNLLATGTEHYPSESPCGTLSQHYRWARQQYRNRLLDVEMHRSNLDCKVSRLEQGVKRAADLVEEEVEFYEDVVAENKYLNDELRRVCQARHDLNQVQDLKVEIPNLANRRDEFQRKMGVLEEYAAKAILHLSHLNGALGSVDQEEQLDTNEE